MRWPRWIPYPVNWLRAIPPVLLVLFFGYSFFSARFFAFFIAYSISQPIFIVTNILPALIISLVVVAFIHKSLFNRNSPQWYPRRSSWYEGLAFIFAIFVVIVATLPVVESFNPCSPFKMTTRYCRPLTDREIQAFLFWGTIAEEFFYQEKVCLLLGTNLR